MKRILAVILFLLVLTMGSTPLYAAQPVDGFMGVPWGATEAQIIQEMGVYSFSEVLNVGSNAGRFIIFKDGGYFAGHAACSMRFDLSLDKMFHGWVAIPAENSSNGWAVYNDIKTKLSAKYGQPDFSREPSGKEDTETRWLIPNGDKKPLKIEIWLYKSPGSYISSSYAVNYAVVVDYYNEALEDELKIKKEQNY